MDRERLRYAPTVAWAAIASFAVVAALELGARFLFDESASERNAFGYDREMSFTVHGVELSIMPAPSRRFWPQHYAALKTPGTRRIVMVGDSVSRGGALEDSVTAELQADLAMRCGVRAEVWNLASPGYGSRRKAVVVDKALDFAPDLVIYHAGITTEFEDAREWERYVEYHSWHPRHWFDQMPFIGRLKLSKLERWYWAWLPDDVRAAQTEPGLGARIAAMASKFDTAAWTPGMLENLDRTVARVRSAGVPMMILVHTEWDPATRRLDDAGLDAILARRYASTPGVMVISNRRLFDSVADPAPHFYDKSHWTSSGNEAVAGALAPAVMSMLGQTGACASRAVKPTPSRAVAGARRDGTNP